MDKGTKTAIKDKVVAITAKPICLDPLIEARRTGDIAAFWADPAKTKSQLGWETQLELNDMVADTWHWQNKNPNGYDS